MNKILPLLLLFLAPLAAFAQTPRTVSAASKAECQCYILADDSFEMFVNGTSVWKADDYNHVVQKALSLQPGDVVVVTVTDKQGGPGGSFAALILRHDAILASSKDFRYSVNPAPGFNTSPNVQSLRAPDLQPLHQSFGLGAGKQPKKAWSQKSDRNFAVVHFKYVVAP